MGLEARCRSLLIAVLPESHALCEVPAEQLEPLLEAALAEARAAWPEVVVADAQFFGHVARHLGKDDPLASLRTLRAVDLYLALACSIGDARAVELFNRQYQPQLDRAIRKMQTRGSQPEDLKQIVLSKMLIDDRGRGPCIAAYSGQGELRSWVRVTAVRTLIDLVRAGDDHAHERLLDEAGLDTMRAPEASPELEYLKRRYRVDFAAAVEAASQKLSVQQRNLLRYQLLDGLTLDAMATICRVHRVTVARWLAEAREQLAEETRRHLSARLGASEAELESITRLVRSQLEVSVRKLFGTSEVG
jgi:RNA polymerase sigma-70 factor (ECF subfamily)